MRVLFAEGFWPNNTSKIPEFGTGARPLSSICRLSCVRKRRKIPGIRQPSARSSIVDLVSKSRRASSGAFDVAAIQYEYDTWRGVFLHNRHYFVGKLPYLARCCVGYSMETSLLLLPLEYGTYNFLTHAYGAEARCVRPQESGFQRREK